MNKKAKLAAKLWMEIDGIRCFGPGPCTLLQFIEETGSIRQAALKMNMSYKKAWEIVNRLNQLTNTDFVLTAKGGEHGGGAYLSDLAKQYVSTYLNLQDNLAGYLQKKSAEMKL